MEGWIKIHKKILEWGWYDSPNTFRLFFHLLLTASWKETEWHGHQLLPGQVVIGRKALAKKLHMSEQNIRTSLTQLKSTQEVTIKTTNKFSIISINNWGKYQMLTNNQPTTNQQLTTSEEVKNKDTDTASLKKASGVSTNKKNMRRTDDRKFGDEYESTIDVETGLPIQAAKSTVGSSMKELLQWAANRRKFGFTNVIKQYAAMKRMRIAGISPDQVKARWKEMENDSYWQEKGFDFTSVVSTFDKKR